ncbi:MmcQ/YjbR family DNA-binding protein, partial [Candidatus Saccharibacteria bacterium]|nr:MmcQ/YjbR family DNA-binding protein [Candidatus Saccharibacteria bacterium]
MHQNPQTNRIIAHIKSEYDVEPEFLWPERYPDYCIFRHSDNRKWFALIGTVPPATLGIDSNKKAEIINLKFDKGEALDFAETSDHIFPAYHMNKNNWITIWLDGTLPNGLIFELIKKSYLLSAK